MKRRSPALFTVFAAGVVVLVLLTGFWLSYLRRPAPSNLVLPPSPSIYNPVLGESYAPAVSEITAEIIAVNPETVQAVLRTISRPSDYFAEYSTIWYFNTTHASARTKVYAGAGVSKIETLDSLGQPDMHYLTDGERLCFWEEANPILLTTVSMGDRSADVPARIPTYETIFNLGKDDILSASYVIDGGRPYIVLTTRGRVYDTKWWISLDTALMHRAELTEKDGSPAAPAIIVDMLDYRIPPPSGDFFKLPDGRTLEELPHGLDGAG